MEQSGDDVGRHDLDLGVVLLYHIVIELTGVGDFLLERLELGLQVQEVLVGLQLRIRFGHGLEVHDRAAQLVFGLDALCHITGLRRLECAGAGLGHLCEHLRFMGSVPLDGLHEIRDEVGALLELHVDLRPAVFDAIAQCDQTVVGGHSPQHYQDDDNECNNAEYHVKILASLLVYLSNFRMRATHFVVLSVFPCTRKSIDANIRTACRTYEKPTPYGVGFSLDYLSASLRRIREKTSIFEC